MAKKAINLQLARPSYALVLSLLIEVIFFKLIIYVRLLKSQKELQKYGEISDSGCKVNICVSCTS